MFYAAGVPHHPLLSLRNAKVGLALDEPVNYSGNGPNLEYALYALKSAYLANAERRKARVLTVPRVEGDFDGGISKAQLGKALTDARQLKSRLTEGSEDFALAASIEQVLTDELEYSDRWHKVDMHFGSNYSSFLAEYLHPGMEVDEDSSTPGEYVGDALARHGLEDVTHVVLKEHEREREDKPARFFFYVAKNSVPNPDRIRSWWFDLKKAETRKRREANTSSTGA